MIIIMKKKWLLDDPIANWAARGWKEGRGGVSLKHKGIPLNSTATLPMPVH